MNIFGLEDPKNGLDQISFASAFRQSSFGCSSTQSFHSFMRLGRGSVASSDNKKESNLSYQESCKLKDAKMDEMVAAFDKMVYKAALIVVEFLLGEINLGEDTHEKKALKIIDFWESSSKFSSELVLINMGVHVRRALISFQESFDDCKDSEEATNRLKLNEYNFFSFLIKSTHNKDPDFYDLYSHPFLRSIAMNFVN